MRLVIGDSKGAARVPAGGQPGRASLLPGLLPASSSPERSSRRWGNQEDSTAALDPRRGHTCATRRALMGQPSLQHLRWAVQAGLSLACLGPGVPIFPWTRFLNSSHTHARVKQPQSRPEPSARGGGGNARFQKALPRTPIPARLAPAPWSRAGQPAASVLALRHGAWLRRILPLSVLFTERGGTARQTASVGHGGLVAKQSQTEAPARFCFCCACTLDTRRTRLCY